MALQTFAGPVLGPMKMLQSTVKQDDSPALPRVIAAYLLANDPRDETTRHLLAATQDENANVRLAAVRSLGEVPRPSDVTQRLQALIDGDSSIIVRYAAAASLVRLQYFSQKDVKSPSALTKDLDCQQEALR